MATLAVVFGAGCGGGDDAKLAIIAPADGAYVEGVVEVEIEATTGAGVFQEVVLRAGSVEVARLTSPPFVVELDTSSMVDGPLTLTVEGSLLDQAPPAPVTVTVRVDNEPPSIELLQPFSAFQEDGEVFSVRVLARDGNGITKVAARAIGEGTNAGLAQYDPSEVVELAFPWDEVVSGPLSSWGEVLVTVQAVDGYGRQAEVQQSFNVGTRLLWSHNVAGLMVRPPIVADDGTVWLGATKISPDEGRIVRLDPLTGSELCDSVLGIETVYSAAQAGGLIVFGTSRAVRAYRRDDCALAWTFGDPVNAPRSYWGTPAYDSTGNVVYAADATGRVVAINAATGAGVAFADVAEAVQSSPLVTAAGEVLIGSESGRLYGFDAAGAPLAWSPYSAAGSIFGDPVLGASAVFFGSMDSYLYALDPATGMLSPGFGVSPDGFALRSTPGVAADGTALVATLGGSVFAIAADGTPRWSYEVGPISRGGVRVLDAQGGNWSAYIGATDGGIYGLSDAGALLWRGQLGAAVQTYGALDATTFYVPSDDFRLSAFDLRSVAP